MSVKLPFACLLLLCLGCERTQEVKKRPPPYVETTRAVAQDMPYVIRTIGSAAALNQVKVVAQVSGELLNYFFADGAVLHEGDVIATIDPRMFEAELEEAQGQLDQAYASLAYNLERVRRYKELLPEDYVAILTYEEYLSNAELAAAQVEQYEGSVRAAEVNLGYTEITAPMSGRAGAQLIDPGNVIYPEEKTPLVVINQISPIYVDFTVPERYFFDLQEYSGIEGLEVEASFIGDSSRKWKGKLTFIDNEISRTTGTLSCKADFANEDESLWPGLWVDVTVKLYTIPDAVLVPTKAIGTDTKGEYVFVVNEESVAELRRIKLGQRFDDWQIIAEGVSKGEEIVTRGQSMLRPGNKVRVRGADSTS